MCGFGDGREVGLACLDNSQSDCYGEGGRAVDRVGLGCLATYELPRHGGGEYTHLSIIIPNLLFHERRSLLGFTYFLT